MTTNEVETAFTLQTELFFRVLERAGTVRTREASIVLPLNDKPLGPIGSSVIDDQVGSWK
jgi:hypothetical protein